MSTGNFVTIKVHPNYKIYNKTKVDDIINDMYISRASVYSSSDLNVVKGNPIDIRNKFLGNF